jgi:hypothetical protein
MPLKAGVLVLAEIQLDGGFLLFAIIRVLAFVAFPDSAGEP